MSVSQFWTHGRGNLVVRTETGGGKKGGWTGGKGWGGGGSSIPAALGAPAAWYDPSDLGSMWQEDTKTTPAAVGSPVGYMTDKSGNGFHLQSTGALRPTLQRDANGNEYLQASGAQAMALVTAAATPCATVIAAAYVASTTESYSGLVTNASDQTADVDFAFVQDGTLASWAIGQAAGGGLSDSLHIWNNRTQSAAITHDATRIYSADGTGHLGTLQFPGGVRLFDDRSLTGRDFIGRLYGLVLYDTILTTAKRNDAEGWLAGKAGVTL